MTTGLDVSYDAGMFKADKEFALYSRLVEDNGVDFAIQALPEKYDELVIPLGIDVPAGTEVTFNAAVMNLPGDAAVWLEDREAGKFTRLDSPDASYRVIISEKTVGVGNFFIYTKSAITAAGSLAFGGNPYNVTANPAEGYIRITSDESNPVQARVYDMAGRMLSTLNLKKGSDNKIYMKGQPGIYLLKITGGKSFYSEKIFWK